MKNRILKKLKMYLLGCMACRSGNLAGCPIFPKRFVLCGPYNREAYNGFLQQAAWWKLEKKPTIMDVGANNGDYSLAFKQIYPDANIHLFEPLPELVERLRRLGARDKEHWIVHDFALGEKAETLAIQIPDHGDESSSLLGFTQEYLKVNPTAAQRHTSMCQVKRLADIMANSLSPIIHLLKIDVEGFEFNVLAGAGEAISRVERLVVEVSKIRHSGMKECPIAKMIGLCHGWGLHLINVEPTLTDPTTGFPVEFDLFFIKAEMLTITSAERPEQALRRI